MAGEERPAEDRRPEAGTLDAPAPSAAAGAIDVLASLPRLLGGALADIRRIADGMRYLPELARTLRSIQAAVESMDDEVRKMRKGVDSMGADVEELAPHLTDLKHSIPLRRLRRRGGAADS